MNRNSKYIYENKIIDPLHHAKPAQVGVDLSIAKIEEITGEVFFDENSKVHDIQYIEAHFALDEETGKKIYYLEPNKNYSITFEQGLVKLNANEWGFIVQRSSLVRCGMHVVSSIYDPGYGIDEKEGIGTTMWTSNCSVSIPVGTRVAQMLIFENEPVDEEDQYHGRWQGTNKVT